MEWLHHLSQRRGFHDAWPADHGAPEIRDDKPVVILPGSDTDPSPNQPSHSHHRTNGGELQRALHALRNVRKPRSERLRDHYLGQGWNWQQPTREFAELRPRL